MSRVQGRGTRAKKELSVAVTLRRDEANGKAIIDCNRILKAELFVIQLHHAERDGYREATLRRDEANGKAIIDC